MTPRQYGSGEKQSERVVLALLDGALARPSLQLRVGGSHLSKRRLGNLIAQGWLRLDPAADENSLPTYALTEKGRRYAIDVRSRMETPQ